MSDAVSQVLVLRRALQRLGWAPTGTFRNRVEYWEPQEDNLRGSVHEVILPLGEDISDRDSLTERALAALDGEYGVEFRKTLQMIETMISKHLDEVLSSRSTEDDRGLIPWDEGSSMVIGTRGLLSAAAKATSRSRRRFANAETPISDAFLERCLMGQTRVGSYVVTALTPAHGSFSSSGSTAVGDAVKAPTYDGRAITSKLQSALAAVAEAVHETRSGGSVEAFDSYINNGVSLELIRSITQVVGDVEASVSIQYNDSDVLDSPEFQRGGQTFYFTPPDAVVLANAAHYFAEAPEPKLAALSGEVIGLRSSTASPERTIQLFARVDGSPRVVHVSLTPEQYEMALEAHKRETRLSVTGELEIRTRGSVIQVAEYVKVEDVPVKRAKEFDAGAPAIWGIEFFDEA